MLFGLKFANHWNLPSIDPLRARLAWMCLPFERGTSMLSKLGLGVALATIAVAVAPAANATDFHIGDVPNFYITSGTPFSKSITANFGNGFSTATTFDDSYFFTIPQDGTGSGSISTSFSSELNKLTITGLWINNVAYTVPATGSGQSFSISGVDIMSNVLNTIRVTGFTSSLGGTYSGTATFSAGAVPEAASWTMMVAGFGVMGAMMRRRRTKLTFA